MMLVCKLFCQYYFLAYVWTPSTLFLLCA
jgi:hypothetical protein